MAVRKSRAWFPPAPPDGQGCSGSCCPPALGGQPQTHLLLSFGSLSRSVLGCYLSLIYLLVVVHFSCRSQGFQPKPQRGCSGPASVMFLLGLREVKINWGMKPVMTEIAKFASQDLRAKEARR